MTKLNGSILWEFRALHAFIGKGSHDGRARMITFSQKLMGTHPDCGINTTTPNADERLGAGAFRSSLREDSGNLYVMLHYRNQANRSLLRYQPLCHIVGT